MRVALHIVNDRRERLRSLIRQDGFIPVAEICRQLNVSEATARRDLASVAETGDIGRTRGGALADYNMRFASLSERTQRARAAKLRIAHTAAALVPSHSTLFLDAGTTVSAIARVLLTRAELGNLTVVTNSLSVATLLGSAPHVELHVLGGTFLHRQAVVFGESTILGLGGWRFDAAFLGGEGMNDEGVTNSHDQIAAFQRAVLMKSARSYFCIDASKLGRSTPHRVTAWDNRVHLITDVPAPVLAAAGIPLPALQVIVAKR